MSKVFLLGMRGDSALLEALLAGASLADKGAWDPLHREAQAYLKAMGLPTKKSEVYRHTPFRRYVREALQGDVAGGVAGVGLPWTSLPAAPCLLPWGDFEGLGGVRCGLSDGGDAAGHEVLQGDLTGSGGDQFVALNSAHLGSVYWIDVPAGVVPKVPLLLSTPTCGRAAVVHPRKFIRVGAGARVTVIETLPASGAGGLFANDVTELHLGAGASVDYYFLAIDQRAKEGTMRHMLITQGEQSHFRGATLALGGGLLRSAVRVALVGEGSRATLDGCYIAQGGAHQEHHVTVVHGARGTRSDTHYRGVAGDRACAVFHGQLTVTEEGGGSEAHQHHHGWLLDDTAHIYAQPRLAIETDEVRCTHGATLRRRDAAVLSYLRSRGLSTVLAEQLLLRAFFQEFLDELPSWLGDWLEVRCVRPKLEAILYR